MATPKKDSKYEWLKLNLNIKSFVIGPDKSTLMKEIQKQTDAYIKEKLEAPNMDILRQWVLELHPDIKWSSVRNIVQRFRNSLPIVSRNIPDGRATSARSPYLPKVFRSPAWVAADLGNLYLRILFSKCLGFMRLKGKNYGNFFIATQTLSGQVFVKKITSKKWMAIKPIIIQMLNTPGFESTKR